MREHICILMIWIVFVNTKITTAQTLYCNIKFVNKTIACEPSNKIGFSKACFYLYRNAVYEIKLRNNNLLTIKIIDIEKERLLVLEQNTVKKTSSFFNEKPIYININEIASIKTNDNREIKLNGYHTVITNDSVSYNLKSSHVKLFKNDTVETEVLSYFYRDVYNYVYVENNKMYWFEGQHLFDRPKNKIARSTSIKKNIIWFTPNKVDVINGLALGLFPTNDKNALLINGVNIEINPIMLFILLRAPFTNIYPDSLDYVTNQVINNCETKIKGVNVSVLGSVGSIEINGINIGGINSTIDVMKGLSVSGLNNFNYYLKGVSIAVLRNRATIARGAQIGLINKATNLRGIQIGLWNINKKRKLPFINWQFKP
ncbi:MAG: hypothetical protein H7331_04545 [Bacteroidia bacterium]|nr:hypothetical protein [Bacteroidia bacterium]